MAAAQQFQALPSKTIALGNLCPDGPHHNKNQQKFHFVKIDSIQDKPVCDQVVLFLMEGNKPQGYTVKFQELTGEIILACYFLAYSHLIEDNRLTLLWQTISQCESLGFFSKGYNRRVAREYYDWMISDVLALADIPKPHPTKVEKALESAFGRISSWIEGNPVNLPEIPPPRLTIVQKDPNYNYLVVQAEGMVLDHLFLEFEEDRFLVFQPLNNGTTKYYIARRSNLVDGFPVGPMSQPLTFHNLLAEMEEHTSRSIWKGDDRIIFTTSNNGHHSFLQYEEVLHIINHCIQANLNQIETHQDVVENGDNWP